MRLFIAEKPSLAKAIVACLPEPHIKDGNCFRCGKNDVVAWCAGHILELAPPDQYSERYKTWSLEDLPILPNVWKFNVTAADLFRTIKNLVKEAGTIVHAGDPDREGQLLVDEVLDFIGNTKPVKRVLINDMNAPAVKKALASIKDNADFLNLSHSALARSRADWLYGLNMTRLYTLLGRSGGYTNVLSIGRVQTPLLGLIVRRDREVMNFKSKPFYSAKIVVSTSEGLFEAAWKAGALAENYKDEAGRVIDKAYMCALLETFKGCDGQITEVSKKNKKERQPLPFSLLGIQVAAAKKHDYSAQVVLDVCQSLYETHGLLTYPRSDCSYLPEEHFDNRAGVVDAIKNNVTSLGAIISGANLSIGSAAWNDKEVTAHHAIIPTEKKADTSRLSEQEAQIYRLVCERYLIQFYPVYEYQETVIDLSLASERFQAKGRIITAMGWKGLGQADVDNENEDADSATKSLPDVKKDDPVYCQEASLVSKETTPPKLFNNTTIAEAMNSIGNYVTNMQVKKILKETDGIGTPATQAKIIETLFDRNYIEKKGKSIVGTKLGAFMVDVLPEVATTPDMTAFWEAAIKRILEGEITLDKFLTGVVNQLSSLITDGAKLGSLKIPGVKIHACPNAACNGVFNKIPAKTGAFWGCSNFKDGCKESRPDEKGEPVWNPTAKKSLSKSKSTSTTSKTAKTGLSSRRRKQ